VNAAGDRLQDTARQAALALPGVSHGHPFTRRLDVYKVAGQVFLIVTDDPDEPIITVKCEPEHAHAQERRFASITPGRYLDKRHWISLGPGSGITDQLITDAVEDSYDLVAERLPRRDRPDPQRRGPT
jgi:predicted DNA-binding protein (MmcQ/YjbR family)